MAGVTAVRAFHPWTLAFREACMPSEVAPLRIGIFGGYGTGNFGNDASFEALRDFLRAEFPNADISAICSKPEPTAKRFGVKAVGIAAPRPEGLWRKLDTLMLLRRVIGYLPLAHILELSAELTCLGRGAKVGDFIESYDDHYDPMLIP